MKENSLEITQYLQAHESGDPRAFESLVPLVYDELHSLAHGSLRRVGKGHALETSDLLHESWARLLKASPGSFENRRHFYGAAARAMRNILIEQARRNSALKRDSLRNEALQDDTPELTSELSLFDRIAIGDVLERFKVLSPRQAEVVWQRFYNQIPFKEIAEVLGVSENTIGRDWKFARAWLQDMLGENSKSSISDYAEPEGGDDE